jgi:formate-dependent nitrite reductase membrane component NrfD
MEMQLHNWMVKYTPQTGWIENKGALVWLSLHAGVVGGGAYLVSLIFNSLWGMFISWLIIVVIKGGLHIAHAEKPSRLWRMVLKPKTSWISRGLIITILLAIVGAAQLAFSYWLPGTAGEILFKVLAGVIALGVMLYAGLALSDVSGIPLWNSAAVPLQFIIWGILSGSALIMVINSVNTVVDFKIIITSNLIELIAASITLILFFWTANIAQPAAKESSQEILKGRTAPLFWIGVVIIGLVLPLIFSASLLITDYIPAFSLAVIILTCELIGGLSLTYCIMKAGFYRPLIAIRV